jgi:hypothetical protein
MKMDARRIRTGKPQPFVLAQSKRAPRTFRLCRSELDVPMEWETVGSSVEVWATWRMGTLG